LPRYHNLDHRAVIATFWGGSTRRLKSYQCDRQRFPLQLSQREETEQTKMFSRLVAECVKPKLCKRQGNDWISNKTWALVGQRTALRQVGKMSRTEGRRMKRLIWASLRNNRAACTKGVSNMIKAELEKGDVQEAFCLLKGWYRAASETVVRPCPQTIAQQMEERVDSISNGTPWENRFRSTSRDPQSQTKCHPITRSGTWHGTCQAATRGGRQKCARRTSRDGSVASRWRRTPRKGPTMWGREKFGASLLASSRLFGCRAKSCNN
jgi:hypothetical protein